MKMHLFRPLAFLILMIVLAGCATPPATPAVTETQAEATAILPTTSPSPIPLTSTPDPCSLPQLGTEVQKVQKHMREFDDAAKLATFVPREQLSNSIADLQRIRREADDEPAPGCLMTLKTLQVQHMNTVIDTLIAFMGGTEQQTLDQGIALARQQHDQYILELARLLGATVVAATLPPPPSETPTPTP